MYIRSRDREGAVKGASKGEWSATRTAARSSHTRKAKPPGAKSRFPRGGTGSELRGGRIPRGSIPGGGKIRHCDRRTRTPAPTARRNLQSPIPKDRKAGPAG